MIGDSWAEGLSPYFLASAAESGKTLWTVINDAGGCDSLIKQTEYIPKYIICCGLNDIQNLYPQAGDSSTQKQKRYSFVLTGLVNALSKANKDVYVCTFPKLQYPGGYKGCVNKSSLTLLNACITSSMSGLRAHIINVPDSVSQNNMGDKIHLKNWKKLADYIINQINQGRV